MPVILKIISLLILFLLRGFACKLKKYIYINDIDANLLDMPHD